MYHSFPCPGDGDVEALPPNPLDFHSSKGVRKATHWGQQSNLCPTAQLAEKSEVGLEKSELSICNIPPPSITMFFPINLDLHPEVGPTSIFHDGSVFSF